MTAKKACESTRARCRPRARVLCEKCGEASRKTSRNFRSPFARTNNQAPPLTCFQRAPALRQKQPIGQFADGFHPLALVETYLRALERPGRDVLRTPAEIAPLTRVRIGSVASDGAGGAGRG